jgi:[acyl-carrier-protein] S-malonyltransferase
MAAVLGLTEEQLQEVCAQAGDVQIANYNAPGQIVISGEQAALERASELATKAGAKRVLPLAVSIASHSELMRPAVEEYREAVEAAPLRPLTMPIISNVTADLLNEVDSVRKDLLDQLVSPVRWTQTIARMTADGVDEFLELGPKDVLTGLIKRIAPGAKAVSVGTPANIKALRVQF